MIAQPQTHRAGYTLIEMCTVMAALALTLIFGATLLLAALRADQVGAATLRGLMGRAELFDGFRADVAGAAAAPDRLGDLTAGPECLILRAPGGDHVIYQWREGRLERVARSADRETRRPVPTGTGDVTVAFDRPAGDRPLITLRLTETPAHGTPRRWEASAALGGNLR